MRKTKGAAGRQLLCPNRARLVSVVVSVGADKPSYFGPATRQIARAARVKSMARRVAGYLAESLESVWTG